MPLIVVLMTTRLPVSWLRMPAPTVAVLAETSLSRTVALTPPPTTRPLPALFRIRTRVKITDPVWVLIVPVPVFRVTSTSTSVSARPSM